MKSRYHRFTALAVLAATAALAAQVVAAPKPAVPLTSSIITDELGSPGTHRVAYTTLLSTGFEGSSGFALAPLEPQNGWTATGVNLPWVSVSNVNPHSGTQHVRMVNNPASGPGALHVSLSPIVGGVPANSPSTTTSWIYISNDGGADHDAFGQAPSQGFISWRVKFSFSDDTGTGPGTIYILDNLGGSLFFINTGVFWNTGVYSELKVQFDPALGEIRYFYDGVQIYTGAIVAGTSVEQVGWLMDNWQLPGESGAMDDLNLIDIATDPVNSAASSWGRIKAAYR